MGLEDFIKSLANKERQDYPMLPLVQVNEQVGLETDPLKMAQAELGLKQASTPLSLGDKLFGREMTQDYQTVNPDTNETEMTTISNYRPGFFNDLASGYRENVTQGFDVNNLAPQNKSWATRIGEGLGTLARFYNKPIGRMAVATGLSMLTDEANPLGEGVKAYVGRQTNMTRDKAYRQGLINMGVDESQVNAIPGIMTDDIYKNLVAAKQAEIMANYRNDMLENTQENQGIMNQIRLQTLANDEKQNALQNYFKEQELDLKRKDLEIRERNVGKNKAAFQKYRQAVKDRNDAIQQIKDLRTAIKDNPNSLGFIVGSLAKGGPVSQKIVNEQLSKNPESIKTRAAVAKLRGTTMHDLLGAAQTLVEQKNLIPFLPDATDNAKTALAKLDQLEKELLREQNSMNVYGNEMGWNYDDIIGYGSSYADKGETNLSPERQEAAEKLRKNGYSEEEIEEYLNSRGL